MSLFDKESGTATSVSNTTLTDTNKEWRVNQFKNWYVKVDTTEYKITSNTSDTLYFANLLIGTPAYTVSFIGREYLTEIESDASNIIKIPDALISKKYNQTNIDLDNVVFAYVRHKITTSFDPTMYFLNLYKMQRAYAYYMLYLIFNDLLLSEETFNAYKKEDFYNQYSETKKDGLSLLQLDYDKDGESDVDEKNESIGGIYLTR